MATQHIAPDISIDEMQYYIDTASALINCVYHTLMHSDIKPNAAASVLYVALDYLDSALDALHAA